MPVDDPYALLQFLGAPPRLVTHARLVTEAAEALLGLMARLRVGLDAELVRRGAALHDAGKVLHPEELDRRGARHEPAGEALLLAHGVAPAVARCCLSHARWATMECSLEELLVALADKLWKGVRDPPLEEQVMAAVMARTGRDRWDVFLPLDSGFEDVAAGGSDRLARSR